MEVAFCLGLVSLLYCYGGYPLLLWLLCRTMLKDARHDAPGAEHPSVAVLLSVHNEECRVHSKINNFQALDYPRDKLEFWIGLDGSSDGTEQLVRSCGDERIHCLAVAERSGKTAVLNRLAKRTGAEILVFTDANAMFRREALRELAAVFRDPGVGLVSGRTVVRAEGGAAEVEGAYYRYENWVKVQEGVRGHLTGADGAIYGMRRSLHEDLQPELINDFAHPCHVILRGYWARFAPAAIAEEDAAGTAGQEFQRQTRMSAQGLYVYSRYIGRLVRAGHWRFAWMLTSHKLARWLGLVWMLLLGAGTVELAGRSPWGGLLLALETGLLALAAAAALFPNRTKSVVFRLPLYLILVHLAYLRGVLKFLAGERYVTWEPRAG